MRNIMYYENSVDVCYVIFMYTNIKQDIVICVLFLVANARVSRY